MKIDIQSQGFKLTEALNRHLKRRLQSAIESRSRLIIGAQARLSDINGPRGGVDKCCQMSVELAGAPMLVVRDTSDNMYVAIDRAAHRLARRIRKRTARLKHFKRVPNALAFSPDTSHFAI